MTGSGRKGARNIIVSIVIKYANFNISIVYGYARGSYYLSD